MSAPEESQPPNIGPPNSVFQALAGDGTDLVGMVAYAVYKRMKREWIIKHNPSAQERQDYHKTITETALQLCRSEAEAKLSQFAQAAIDESANSFKQQGANSEIVNEVKKQQSFGRNLACNILGSIVFAALLYLFGLIYFAPNIQDIVAKPPARQSDQRP